MGEGGADPCTDKPADQLTHLDAQGRIQMVDVGGKPPTERVAVACGEIVMRPETLHRLVERGLPKGDAFTTAQIAGIMAAKRTAELIPLCHPLPLTHVELSLQPNEARSCVEATATVRSYSQTGVEMEALTAVTIALLTIYDMAKAMEKTMRIGNVRLVYKRGGKSGEFRSVEG